MATTGNCFRCREPGHWISDCPLKSNADDPPPAIHCPCSGGLCEIKVSNTRVYPGRKFYKCPTAQDCRFFMWCDKVTDEHIRFRPASIIPNCPCGSGPCQRVTVDSGPNAGRAYLQCCIKKHWDVEVPPNCDALDEIDFWVEADLISSDVESSFQVCVPEHANQVAPPEKECQGSVSIEDDSIFENLDDAMFVSLHPAAAVNQDQVAVVDEPDEPWRKTLPSDQPASSALSNSSFTESYPLNVDEAVSGLSSVDPYEIVKDILSSGSTVKHDTTNHEEPVAGTGESEWPFKRGPYLQVLIEQYNSQNLQFESVSGKHVQVLSAFMDSYKRLRSLQEKTCYLRKTLLETEKEMACCEAETLEFGVSCREVAGEMAESQKRMQETAEKLGEEFVSMKIRRI